MANKTTLDERCLGFLGARVPDELQDELAELYKRGYRGTEIIKEGIRACSAREGLMARMHTVVKSETTVGREGQ